MLVPAALCFLVQSIHKTIRTGCGGVQVMDNLGLASRSLQPRACMPDLACGSQRSFGSRAFALAHALLQLGSREEQWQEPSLSVGLSQI